MWKCEKCNVQIEDQFGVCWHCGSNRNSNDQKSNTTDYKKVKLAGENFKSIVRSVIWLFIIDTVLVCIVVIKNMSFKVENINSMQELSDKAGNFLTFFAIIYFISAIVNIIILINILINLWEAGKKLTNCNI